MLWRGLYRLILMCSICSMLTITAKAEAVFKVYRDTNSGYNIEYLSQLDVLQSQFPDGGTHFVDNTSSPPELVFNVNKTKTNQTIETLASSAENYIREQPGISNFKIISEKSLANADRSGIEKLISYTLGDSQLSSKIAYIMVNNDIITVTMAGSLTTLERHEDAFRHMLESIEFY